MPLIYSLVSHRGTLQAESSAHGVTGNFGDVAKMLVKKLPAKNDKLSYSYGEYMFHYIVQDGWTYLAIADQQYQRMLAFQFLNELVAFVKNPSAATTSAIAAAISTDQKTPTQTPLQQFLNKQMLKYNSLVTEKHQKLYADISEVKDAVIENIDKVLERGERIELLVDKTEALNERSFAFKRHAKKMRDEMWWRNTRLILILCAIGIFLLYIIVSSQCGGLSWPDC